MLKKEDFESIKDNELKSLLITLNNFKNIVDGSRDKIMPDDNDKASILIKCGLARHLYDKLVNKNVINSFNISDNFKYYKKQEIAHSLRNCVDDETYIIFKKLVWTESSSSWYDEVIKFILAQDIDLDENMLNKIHDYTENKDNKNALYAVMSDYLSLDEEQRLLVEFLMYKNSGCKNPPKEFVDYALDYYQRTERERFRIETKEQADLYAKGILDKYQRRHTGNVGEYFTQDMLISMGCNPIFVSRDYGDGFGYDHHSLFQTEENLFESKATLIDADRFSLSENEYNVLLDCINQDNRKYFVSRVNLFYNTAKKKDICVLKPIDDKQLVPYNEDNNYSIIYKYDYDDDKGGKVFIKK